MSVADSPCLTYRTIDPITDATLAFSHYRDAAIATYGPAAHRAHLNHYLPWLRSRVEEYPDGHVLAYLDNRCVGQLELQVPYGLATGYINLFYVTPRFRRQGFGRALHVYAQRYFASWEAKRIELDVSPTNYDAIGFYQAMGYRLTNQRALSPDLRRMAKTLQPFSAHPVQPPAPPT